MSSSRPGSKIGISPRFNASILLSSMSTQATSWPESEKHVPATRPTYPVPTIVIFIATNLFHFALSAHRRSVSARQQAAPSLAAPQYPHRSQFHHFINYPSIEQLLG